MRPMSADPMKKRFIWAQLVDQASEIEGLLNPPARHGWLTHCRWMVSWTRGYPISKSVCPLIVTIGAGRQFGVAVIGRWRVTASDVINR